MLVFCCYLRKIKRRRIQSCHFTSRQSKSIQILCEQTFYVWSFKRKYIYLVNVKSSSQAFMYLSAVWRVTNPLLAFGEGKALMMGFAISFSSQAHKGPMLLVHLWTVKNRGQDSGPLLNLLKADRCLLRRLMAGSCWVGYENRSLAVWDTTGLFPQ